MTPAQRFADLLERVRFHDQVQRPRVGVSRCLNLFPTDQMNSWRSSSGMASVTSSLADWQSEAPRFAIHHPRRRASHRHETGRICAGSRPRCENSTRRSASLGSRARSSFQLDEHSFAWGTTWTFVTDHGYLDVALLPDGTPGIRRSAARRDEGATHSKTCGSTWPAWPTSSDQKRRLVAQKDRAVLPILRQVLERSSVHRTPGTGNRNSEARLLRIRWAARVSIPAPWD